MVSFLSVKLSANSMNSVIQLITQSATENTQSTIELLDTFIFDAVLGGNICFRFQNIFQI